MEIVYYWIICYIHIILIPLIICTFIIVVIVEKVMSRNSIYYYTLVFGINLDVGNNQLAPVAMLIPTDCRIDHLRINYFILNSIYSNPLTIPWRHSINIRCYFLYNLHDKWNSVKYNSFCKTISFLENIGLFLIFKKIYWVIFATVV